MDTRAERRGGRLVNAFDAAQATREVWDRIWEVASTERVVVVNSPPGAGKSTLTREMARRALLIEHLAAMRDTAAARRQIAAVAIDIDIPARDLGRRCGSTDAVTAIFL